MKYSINRIKQAIQSKSYAFFENGSYNLNIIGIRSAISRSNEFDDYIYVIYKDGAGSWICHEYKATTDPGKPYLLNPLAGTKGTAILVPDQYRGTYTIGIHGRSRPSVAYKALEQVKDMRYVRDNNRDSVIDSSLYSNPSNIFSANLKTNIHRASKNVIARFVEKHSAGCQVIQNPAEFDEFLALCEISSKKYGNRFTYTLLEEKDVV